MQDDPTAEGYLAFLYEDGRGAPQNDREAFNWYYRAAINGNSYGAKSLGFMYRHGLGVKANIPEALKWYKKAAAASPEDEALKKTVARTTLTAFLKSPDTTSLDTALIMQAYHREIVLASIILAAVYAAGGIVLLFFTLKAADAPAGLPVALGWMAFYVESQGVAACSMFIFGQSLTADTIFLTLAVFAAVPVIASSCGRNRFRIWKASLTSRKMLIVYGVGAYVAMLTIFRIYAGIYTGVTHTALPSQPTVMLISKAKHASVWLTYACVGLIMPAAEELIFRQYLFGALRRRFPGGVVVIVSALAFSAAHFQWLYFVPLFCFGLVLGWLRLKTDSVRLPLILHAINNSLSFAFGV